MGNDRLNVVEVLSKKDRSILQPQERKNASQVKFERLWNDEPHLFMPSQTAIGRDRLKKTSIIIENYASKGNILVADLGAGDGSMSSIFAKNHAAVIHAVDVARNALEYIAKKRIPNAILLHDYVPQTKLEDDFYDFVVSTELIGYLHPNQYRLYFSELARIVKPEGYIICSTQIDVCSEDALQRFIALAETEIEIHEILVSYHALSIKINRFLNWKFFKFIFSPISKWLEQSDRILHFFEKICRFFSPELGISHIILIGKRKKMINPSDVAQEAVIERKRKKEIWE